MTQMNEKDIESQLIQKMSEISDKLSNDKGFFSKLIDSAPSIFVSLFGVSIMFYIYVQVELSNLQNRESFREQRIAEMVKTMNEIKQDLTAIERKLLTIELQLRNSTPSITH